MYIYSLSLIITASFRNARKNGKKATEMQKTARGFFHGCLSVFVFSPYFFRLLLCSAGSAECSFPIKHIPLRVRKLCFRFDVSRKFPGFFFHNPELFTALP